MTTNYMNVKESAILYDTILIGAPVHTQTDLGWFGTYAGLGAVTELNFFNVRNRSVGLPYCNLQTRDQTPFGFRLNSIGVTFFSNSLTVMNDWAEEEGTITYNTEDKAGAIFTCDLPQHASVTLNVNQDERYKSNCMFTPPGYGPVTGGIGRGSASGVSDFAADGAIDTQFSGSTQGVARLKNRWKFPMSIDIPMRASISVKIRFEEWARQLLQTMPGPESWVGLDSETAANTYGTIAGIQVSLMGERLVQQRGEYHA